MLLPIPLFPFEYNLEREDYTMDTQTRIGVGAAALFGITAFIEPAFGWRKSFPALLAFY